MSIFESTKKVKAIYVEKLRFSQFGDLLYPLVFILKGFLMILMEVQTSICIVGRVVQNQILGKFY